LKEVDALEGSYSKLKAILDKKKKTAKEKGPAADEKKPVDPKKTAEKVPEKEPETEKEPESSNKVWKKKPPTKTTKTSEAS